MKSEQHNGGPEDSKPEIVPVERPVLNVVWTHVSVSLHVTFCDISLPCLLLCNYRKVRRAAEANGSVGRQCRLTGDFETLKLLSIPYRDVKKYWLLAIPLSACSVNRVVRWRTAVKIMSAIRCMLCNSISRKTMRPHILMSI